MSNIRTRFQEHILWLLLDHPPLNMLSIEMLDQLTAAMKEALKMGPRLVVFTGTGERAFSAGVNIHEQMNGREKELARALMANCAAFEDLHAHKIATVALVKGLALGGGCGIALLCDTVLAREDATFGLPDINMGISSPVASVYLPRISGYQSAMRLLLTGETINAREALRLGIAHQVLSTQSFITDAEELLVMLASTHHAQAFL